MHILFNKRITLTKVNTKSYCNNPFFATKIDRHLGKLALLIKKYKAI